MRTNFISCPEMMWTCEAEYVKLYEKTIAVRESLWSSTMNYLSTNTVVNRQLSDAFQNDMHVTASSH